MSRWQGPREPSNSRKRGERAPFVERAIRGGSGVRRGPTGQPQRPSPTQRPVFFDLHIYEVRKGQPEDQWPCVHELSAGHTYALRVSGRLDGTTLEDNLCPRGILIEKSIRLCLPWPAEIQKKRAKEVREFTLSYQEAKSYTRRFIFKLPGNIPSGSIDFSLGYARTGQMLYQTLGHRRVTVRSGHDLEQDILRKCQIQEGLPPGMALLMVDFARSPARQDQHYQLSLYGWTYRGRLLQETATLDALVSVARLFQRDKEEKRILDPENIFGTILRFSRTFSDRLLKWLQDLNKGCGNAGPPCLIIVDHTSLCKEIQLEIPWEMLELEAGAFQFLGARMQVVRWLPFRKSCWLKVEKVRHSGALLSYLDANLGNARIQAEYTILAQLGSQPFASLTDLENRLRRTLRGIGLVYIGCHGLAGSDLFAGLQRPSTMLSALRLELLHPPPGEAIPPFTVFLNACESVRITGNYYTYRGSFVEGFLANGASGFIGTLAGVDIETAAENAQFILSLLTSGEEISIAEALRRSRAETVYLCEQELRAPDGNQKRAVYKMLDRFMYVYYGDPLASLDLRPVASEADAPIPPEEDKEEGA